MFVQSRIDCSGICGAATWISDVAVSIYLVKCVCLEVYTFRAFGSTIDDNVVFTLRIVKGRF